MTATIREVKIGEVFTVTLQEKATTGYLWEHISKDDFEVISVRTVMNDVQGRHAIVGGTATRIFSLQAKTPGEFDLNFAMRRPWQRDSNPIESYHEIIMVSE